MLAPSPLRRRTRSFRVCRIDDDLEDDT